MKFLNNIKILIFIFLLIRFYGITNPPLEVSHNWRQAFTNMVARNFVEQPSLLHPRIDMEGGKEVAIEFPFFSYLIYLCNKFFGYAHWYGRLINLFVTSAGIYFFYRIVKKSVAETAAFYGAIILSVSIYFSFGRKIMPDTFSASLVLAGIFFAFEFIYSENKLKQALSLIISCVLLTIGLLCKIPSLVLFGFLLFPLLDRTVTVKKKAVLIITLACSLIFPYWWYAFWNPHLLSQGAYKIIFPLGLADGFHELLKHIPGVLEKFYFSALCSYLSLIVFIGGIYYTWKKDEIKLAIVFITSFFVFLVFIITAASFFHYHNYYIIPFVPFMALIAGYGLYCINNPKIKKAIIVLLVIESILNQQHDFRLPSKMTYKTELEKLLNNLSATNEKIILNTGPSMQQLYFANRKGWLMDKPVSIRKTQIDSLSGGNYSVVVLDKAIHTAFNPTEFKSVYEDEHFLILRKAGDVL